MSELDVVGTIFGTDKSSTIAYSWDYLRHYEELFQKFRTEPINLIEIGVDRGSSVDVWLHYFTRATIVGVDVNPACKRLARERVVIEIGSQENPQFLQAVAQQHKPTIVIDDGSHLAHHMIAAFETLFPALAPGGYYVFEDLSFHFEDGVGQFLGAKAQQGQAEKSIYDYLGPFLRARTANIASPRGAWGFQRYAFENIDSLTVIGGALILRKRAARAFEAETAMFERVVREHGEDTVSGLRYAAYLGKHRLNPGRAGDLLEKYLAKNPADVIALELLYAAALETQRPEKALDCARRIAELRPEVAQSWRRQAEAHRRLNQPGPELAAWRRTIGLDPNLAEALRRISALSEAEGDIEAALAAAVRARDLAPVDANALARVRALEAKRPAGG